MLLSATMAAVVSFWTVNTPVINMHAKPDRHSPVVSQAIYGTAVTERAAVGEWLEVRTPDDYTGWVRVSNLRRRDSVYGSSGSSAMVDSLFANIYPLPDVTRHAPILTLPFETRLEVIAMSEPARGETEPGRWVAVRLVDDTRAWVQHGDLSFRSEPLDIGETIQLARRFLGLPYYWGGVSSFGFDCSGFTQMLYRRRGIHIPRDSRPQSKWDGMMPIAPEKLQPGDLLYFGPSLDRINHTGMYIGGGEFIHASTYRQPRVQIGRLDDAHWKALLVACRRPK